MIYDCEELFLILNLDLYRTFLLVISHFSTKKTHTAAATAAALHGGRVIVPFPPDTAAPSAPPDTAAPSAAVSRAPRPWQSPLGPRLHCGRLRIEPPEHGPDGQGQEETSPEAPSGGSSGPSGQGSGGHGSPGDSEREGWDDDVSTSFNMFPSCPSSHVL